MCLFWIFHDSVLLEFVIFVFFKNYICYPRLKNLLSSNHISHIIIPVIASLGSTGHPFTDLSIYTFQTAFNSFISIWTERIFLKVASFLRSTILMSVYFFFTQIHFIIADCNEVYRILQFHFLKKSIYSLLANSVKTGLYKFSNMSGISFFIVWRMLNFSDHIWNSLLIWDMNLTCWKIMNKMRSIITLCTAVFLDWIKCISHNLLCI